MISEKQLVAKPEIYVIRYVGCPSNPRFKVDKPRTVRVRGTEADARRYADSLAKGQGVKVLSVKPKEA